MNDRIFRMTDHATDRARDRCIPEIACWLLQEFGARRRAGAGAESYYFDKKAWRETERFFGTWQLSQMEKLRRVYMVISDSGAVITLAYRDK